MTPFFQRLQLSAMNSGRRIWSFDTVIRPEHTRLPSLKGFRATIDAKLQSYYKDTDLSDWIATEMSENGAELQMTVLGLLHRPSIQADRAAIPIHIRDQVLSYLNFEHFQF